MSQVPDHFFEQSGVIPYRWRAGQLEVMLITSLGRKRWIIPKGVVEPELTPAQSAAQEAWEEAGLTGRVSSQVLGSYRNYKWGGVCRIEVYLLEVEQVADSWPEAGQRQRLWLSPEAAARRVEEDRLKELILNLPKTLPAGPA
jgi:8-oxo-dGTP pyrophosphatase MutT (NUDIX family)